jgi:putative photosynthetic complex assembly protein 2
MTLADLAPPVLAAAFAWWFSTGAILMLVRSPRAQHGWLLASGAMLAMGGAVASAHDSGALASYAGFLCALCVWGWHEASFLMGVVTGPRPLPCPPGATGWARFKYATLAVLHHEIALALTALAFVALTWGAPNQTATATFLVLFVLRLSAKLNLFLGVPRYAEEFFPAHLAHLKSYLPRRPMNVLLPFSLLGAGALAAWLLHRALETGSAGFALVFALTALGLIEHVFMIAPVSETALWRWAVGAPDKRVEKHIASAGAKD